MRPRGRGFSFEVDSRLDTDKWLEVSGIVRRHRHLVLLEGASVALADPPPETPPVPTAAAPTAGPRPQVVFSTPTPEETDVASGARVRLQFSRDLDPKSIAGQVRVSYLGAAAAPGGTAPGELTFAVSYDEGARVLEIRFTDPLEPFRTVKVDLLEGITATDGAPLVPHSLLFTLGG
jgi:hypothetical protein